MRLEPAKTYKVARPRRHKMNLVEIRALKSYYFTREGVVKAVDSASLDIKKGESVGLVGESGCGKTTFGYSILRLSF